jgi:hypothetical protein
LGVGLTTPPRKKKLLRKSIIWEAFEEGKGPHRAVELVMMMMLMKVYFYDLKIVEVLDNDF